ncbi:MAG: hypothetical protein GY944_06070 [bacterium]|nr:hypothetical protein [bacterium]
MALATSGELQTAPPMGLLRQVEFLDAVGYPSTAIEQQVDALERAHEEHANHAGLAVALAWRYVLASSLRRANDLYKELIVSRVEMEASCDGLAETLRRWDDPEDMADAWVLCANNAAQPDHIAAYWSRAGVVRRDHNDYAGAIEAFDSAREAGGDRPRLLESIGLTYEFAGEFANAMAWYRGAGKLSQGDVESFSTRMAEARVQLRQGEPNAAITILETFSADHRDREDRIEAEIDRLQLLAQAHLQLKQLDEFRSYCGARESETAMLVFARFEWDAHKDRDRTRRTLNSIVLRDPRTRTSRVQEAALRFEIRDLETAEILMKDVPPSAGPAASRTWMNLWIARGELEQARKFASAAIAAEPWQAISWEHKARIEIASGRFIQARRSVEFASRALYPRDAGNSARWWKQQRQLLMLDASLGGIAGNQTFDWRLAADLDLLLNRLPFDGELWHALAKVHRRLGDSMLALEAQTSAAKVSPHRYTKDQVVDPFDPGSPQAPRI